MCVDEQAQYSKHLAAFSSSSSSSRANAIPGTRPGARPRQQRGRGVVFSNGVVIHKQEGLLPTSKPQEEQEKEQAAAAATVAAADGGGGIVKPAAGVAPL